MSFSCKRNSADWSTVSAGGHNVVATNKFTGEVFTGTIEAFTQIMNDALSGMGVLSQSSIPVGIAPTGSVDANGALTAGTALPATYSSGIWLYLPAAAAFTLSPAGIYYCVMSSTTLGTIYNITLAAGTTPYKPSAAALTAAAIVDARGATAYTGATTAVALVTFPVAGGMIGANGSLEVSFEGSHPTGAGTKIYAIKGDTATWLTTTATTTTGALWSFTVRNEGSQAVNVSTAATAQGNGTRGLLLTAVDTSADFNMTLNGTLNTATDYMIYEGYTVKVLSKM